MGRAARCLPWQVLFRAAFPRTTLAPFSARGSPVTYAVAWAGCPWMASWQARQTMRVLRRILVILAAQAGCPGPGAPEAGELADLVHLWGAKTRPPAASWDFSDMAMKIRRRS
jgi:hypothetical protein